MGGNKHSKDWTETRQTAIDNFTGKIDCAIPISSQFILVNQVVDSLIDMKHFIIRYLLIRTEFTKYFSYGFDELKKRAKRESLDARGFKDHDFFDFLLVTFKGNARVREQKKIIEEDLKILWIMKLCLADLNANLKPLLPAKQS